MKRNIFSKRSANPMFRQAWIGDGCLKFLVRKAIGELFPDLTITTWHKIQDYIVSNSYLTKFSVANNFAQGCNTFEARFLLLYNNFPHRAEKLAKEMLLQSKRTLEWVEEERKILAKIKL